MDSTQSCNCGKRLEGLEWPVLDVRLALSIFEAKYIVRLRRKVFETTLSGWNGQMVKHD